MATAKESLSGNIAFGMPVREFLESFLPVDVPQQAKFKKSDFQDFYTQGHEQIDCLNLKELTKYSMWIMIGNNMTWFSPVSVQTNGAGITVPSDGSTWIPDLIVRHTQDVDSKNPRTSDLSSGEFFIEVRDTDNLIDTGNPGEYSDRELNTIYSVLLHSLNHKYATHIYHVICTPCIARLLRLDRSSLVISQPIPIDKDSTLLAEFLWRYTNADSEARGYDTTVRFPSEAEIALAESHLSSFLRGCKGRHAFVIFDVPSGPPNSSDKLQASDVVSSSLSMKHFIACEPISQSPKGRATIGYAALDLLSKRVVFLKDSWRTDTDQFCKEADILRDLNAHSVKHVPTLLAGGDLPGPYQRTWTRNIVDADWRMGPKTDIVPRAHHRLVEDYLPNDLFSFKTPRSLMQFTYDTLIAHQEAYEKCGVLHRDISPNNIRIKNDEEGILADWDHAVYIHRKEAGKSESSANVFGRVGTLPYIAYGLAMKPNQPKVLMHDLESVLWLVLDMGLCFIPFATSDSLDIHFHYNRLFHPAELLSPTSKAGGQKRMVLDGGSIMNGLPFINNSSLNRWLKNIEVELDKLYGHLEDRDPEMAWYPGYFYEPELFEGPPPPEFYTHSFMIRETEAALANDEWADNRTDNAVREFFAASSGDQLYPSLFSNVEVNGITSLTLNIPRATVGEPLAVVPTNVPACRASPANTKRKLQDDEEEIGGFKKARSDKEDVQPVVERGKENAKVVVK